MSHRRFGCFASDNFEFCLADSSSARPRSCIFELSTRGFQDYIPSRHRPKTLKGNNSWKSLGLINRASHSHIDRLQLFKSSVHFKKLSFGNKFESFRNPTNSTDSNLPTVHLCWFLHLQTIRTSSQCIGCISYSAHGLLLNNSSSLLGPCKQNLLWVWIKL